MSTRTSRAVKGTLTSFIQYGLQIGLQALLAPLILSVAGRETLGAYAILMQAVGYLALVDLGFGVSLNRYLAQAFGLENIQFSNILTTGRTFYLGSNTLCALLTLALAAVIGRVFSLSPVLERQAQFGLLMLAAWAVIRTPLAVYGAALIATQNLAAANVISIVGNAGRLVLSLAFVALGGGLVGLMAANILAEAMMAAAQWWHFRRLYQEMKFRWGVPDWALFGSMLKFGGQTLLISIAIRLVFQTDNLVVGYLYGAAAVSVYYITQMPGTLAYQMVLRLTDNATPAINELYGRGHTDSLQAAYLRLHRYTWIMIAPIALGIVFFSAPVIALWVGVEQYAGHSVVIALAIFSMQVTVAHVSNAFVMAQGQIRILSYLALMEGILNLLLSVFLGRAWGLPGVMWATTIANLPTSLYLLWRGQKIMGIGFGVYIRSVTGKVIIPAIIAGISAVGVLKLFCISGRWTMLVTAISSWGMIYAGSAYRLSLNGSERLKIETFVRAKLKLLTI